jgi:hypothetical protein
VKERLAREHGANVVDCVFGLNVLEEECDFELIAKGNLSAIDDVLWKEAGCATELDYTEQTSWMLFLKQGDVLLVQSGHIGHSAVVTKKHEGHNCHAMVVLTPKADVVTGPYLSLLFNSRLMREKFQRIRSGSTVPHLTCREVKELIIAVPKLIKQQTVVEHSQEIESRVMELESVYQQKLTAPAELKQSLLQEAFSGELTAGKEASTSILKEEEVA